LFYIFITTNTPPMTSKASHDAYDTLINLCDKLTRLNGMIMPEAVDKLEDELGRIFTVAKTHHYANGQKYGHLASAIPKAKYRLVINDAEWTHTVPTDPGAYSADALGAGNAATTREQFVAQHKIKQNHTITTTRPRHRQIQPNRALETPPRRPKPGTPQEPTNKQSPECYF
jgi:hypothetical protein